MEPYRHKVQVYETDNMGITHHSNYVRFMEEARVDLMERLGFGYDKVVEQGVSSPVMAISCEFKRPTTYPDIIDIEVVVLEMSTLKLKFGYSMKVDGKIVFKGESLHCFLDANGRPVAYAERFPEITQAFANLK